MILIKNINILKAKIKKEKRKGKTIGFVPTMGCLHRGHLSLLRKAAKECDTVVVSIFVNPTQFGPTEDYRQYPRGLKRDLIMLKNEGADIAFAPSAKSMYPNGYQTYVEI